MSGSIDTDWNGLKKLGKEFFDLAPTATPEELDNGFKCFGIAWMSCTFSQDFFGKLAEEVEHPALWRIVNKEYIKRRFPKTDWNMSNRTFRCETDQEALEAVKKLIKDNS